MIQAIIAYTCGHTEPARFSSEAQRAEIAPRMARYACADCRFQVAYKAARGVDCAVSAVDRRPKVGALAALERTADDDYWDRLER